MKAHLLVTVLNEASVIERCVSSAIKAGCSAVLLLDTGCTDDTVWIARKTAQELGASFYSRRHTWAGFANARNVLLEASAELDDTAYSLMLDADEYVEGSIDCKGLAGPGFYSCRLLGGDWEVWNIKLTNNAYPWRYVGDIHEVAELWNYTPRKLHGLDIINANDGRTGQSDPEEVRQRYLRDAAHFRAQLDKDPNNSRAAYYYAQSLMDAGQAYPAMVAFGERANMTHGFGEERYLAAWRYAQYREAMGAEDAGWGYLRAHRLRPWRLEALGSAVNWFSERDPKMASELSALAETIGRQGGRDDLFLLKRSLYRLPTSTNSRNCK